MAALYPHKIHGWRVVYYLYFPDGSNKRKDKFFKSKQKALLSLKDIEQLELYSAREMFSKEELTYYLHKKYLTKEEAEIISPQKICIIPAHQLTWDKLLQVYKDHVTKVGSDMTRVTYPYRANVVIEYFKNISPLQMTEKLIDDFFTAQRKKNKQKSTINKYLTVLRIMFDYLVQIGAMTENPARKVTYFKITDERQPRILYPDEFKRFMQGIKAHSHLCCGYFAEMCMTYIYTGLRRYELVFLQSSNINLRSRKIIIKGKGNKERVLDIHPHLLPVFQSVLKKNNRNASKKMEKEKIYLFGGGKETVVNYSEVSKAFRKFRCAINFPSGITLHSLRHTFITYLLSSGVDLREVQAIAGHERISTTQKYLQLIPREHPAINALDYNQFIDNQVPEKVK